MRKLTATLCLTLAVLLFSPTEGWSADFQKGLDAANSGDFATALREWEPLAEQGDARAQYYMGWMYDDGDCATAYAELYSGVWRHPTCSGYLP